MTDFNMRGYNGLHCGRVRWGLRVDGEILQISGDLAATEAQTAGKLADNCSRIDLAVTVKVDPVYPGLELAHWKEHLAAYNREGRKASATLVQSDDGGSTFYLGKRTSDVMLRVYDKAVESGEERYAGCHRYELEIKGDRGLRMLQDLTASPDPSGLCRDVVYSWAEGHGLCPIFDSATHVHLVPGLRRRSDTDTKLAWLSAAVRPTVDWLREFGHQAKVLHALGYDDEDGAKLLSLDEVRESLVAAPDEWRRHE
jgi:DNA relaxase NicK